MPANTFDFTSFDARSLTTRANDATKIPFVEQATAADFETDSIRTGTAQIDRESYGASLLPTGTYGTTATAQGSSRSKGTFPVNRIKIGDKLEITPGDFDSIRMVGVRDGQHAMLETFQSMVDKGLNEIFASLDKTREFLRMTAIRGAVKDPASPATTLTGYDFGTLYGVAKPAVLELKLSESNPKMGNLRKRFTDAERSIRDALGGLSYVGTKARYGKSAWDKLRDHPELRTAFERAEDGAYLRDSGLNGVRFAGIEHSEYRGPALGDDEIVIYPVGVSGMFVETFTPADGTQFANTMGLPRYVIPRNANDALLDFDKGAAWELSTLPTYTNLWPEAVVNAVGTTTGAST